MATCTITMNVPHCHQVDDWDCGITAVLMILRGLCASSDSRNRPSSGGCEFAVISPNGVSNSYSYEYVASLYPDKSTWTIDLLDTLRKHGVDAALCTSTLGVDQGLESLHFYSSDDQFESDSVRVNGLFRVLRHYVHHGKLCLLELARSFNEALPLIPMNSTSTSGSISGRVCTQRISPLPYTRHGAAIVLVDATKLRCIAQYHAHASAAAVADDENESPRDGSGDGFLGHYIVLTSSRPCRTCSDCVVSRLCNNPIFVYHNPSEPVSCCEIDLNSLTRAWDTYGTDHDVILVKYPK